MRQTVTALGIVLLVLCAPRPPSMRNRRIAAAQTLTTRSAHSPLASWHFRASASGSDCAVLLVETPATLDDSIVEAIHYGAGAYRFKDGGVQGFGREHAFRGVAYRDASGHVWTYGSVTRAEAEALAACH